MSEKWIQVSNKILDQIKRLEEVKERHRLELVRSIRFMLNCAKKPAGLDALGE